MADKTSSVDTNIEWKTDSYAIDVNKEEIVYLESYINKYRDTSLQRPTEITASRLTSSNSDKNGYTLLCWACAKGAPPEVIAYLLSNNAYSGKCAKGKTPIQLACLSMNVDAIKILLGNQIDYEIKEYNDKARTEISKEPKQIAKTADTSNNKLNVSSKDLLTAATLPESDVNLLTVLVDDVIKRIIGMGQSYELIDNGDLYKQIHSLIEYTCGTDNYGNTLLILATQAQNYASVDCLKNLNIKYGLISTDIETKADVPVKSDHKKIALYIAEDILEDDGIKNKILGFYRSEGVLNKFSDGDLTLDNLLIDGFYSVFKKLIYDVGKIKSASDPKGKNDLSWFNDNDAGQHRLDAFELAYSYTDGDYDSKPHNESPFGFNDISEYENIVYKLATSLSYKLSVSNFKDIDNTRGSDSNSTSLSNVYRRLEADYKDLTAARKKTLMTRLLDSKSVNLVSSLFTTYAFISKDDFEYSLANSSKYHKSTDCHEDNIGYIVANKIVSNTEYQNILEKSIVKNRLSYLLVDVYSITNAYQSKRTTLCQIILDSKANRKPIIIDDLNLTNKNLYDMLYTQKGGTPMLENYDRADIVDYSLSRLCYNELSDLIKYILGNSKGQTRDNIKWLDDNIKALGFSLQLDYTLFKLVIDNDCSNVLDESYTTFDDNSYYYTYVNSKLSSVSLGNNVSNKINSYYGGSNIDKCITNKAYYILQKLYDLNNLTGDNYIKINKFTDAELNVVYRNYKHATNSNWASSLLHYAVTNNLYNTINYVYTHVGLDEFELTKLRDLYRTEDEKPEMLNSDLWEDLFPKPPEPEDPLEDPIENTPPVVIISSSFMCNSESSIVLDASSSHDIEDDNLTFKWTGDGSLYLDSKLISKPTFTAPSVLHDTLYQLTVTATDSGGLSSSKVVTVQCIASKNIGTFAFASGTFAVETDPETKMCTTTNKIKTVKSEWENAYAVGYTSQQIPKEPYSLIYDIDATVTK